MRMPRNRDFPARRRRREMEAQPDTIAMVSTKMLRTHRRGCDRHRRRTWRKSRLGRAPSQPLRLHGGLERQGAHTREAQASQAQISRHRSCSSRRVHTSRRQLLLKAQSERLRLHHRPESVVHPRNEGSVSVEVQSRRQSQTRNSARCSARCVAIRGRRIQRRRWTTMTWQRPSCRSLRSRTPLRCGEMSKRQVRPLLCPPMSRLYGSSAHKRATSVLYQKQSLSMSSTRKSSLISTQPSHHHRSPHSDRSDALRSRSRASLTTATRSF